MLAGNLEMMTEQQLTPDRRAAETAQKYLKEGCTVIYLAVDGALEGILALADTLRPEAGEMIGQLSAMHVETVLLTGDHKTRRSTLPASWESIRFIRNVCGG